MFRMLRKRQMPVVRGANEITSFIHTDDAATAVIAALERGRPGAIYNIADDEPVSFNAFMEAIAREIGAPQPFGVPLWLLRVFAPFMAATLASRLPLANALAKRE